MTRFRSSIMKNNQEIEIKFRIENIRSLQRKLRAAGFRCVTTRTHELNTLYDLPGQVLRKRGDLLRLRKYGETWILTHKNKGRTGRHKARTEYETQVGDGAQMALILESLGYRATFIYEKFRAEWTDGRGHVVVDETPIGNVGEIEGSSRWIDSAATKLGITSSQYITLSYTELFFAWKKKTKSAAKEMTFRTVRGE